MIHRVAPRLEHLTIDSYRTAPYIASALFWQMDLLLLYRTITIYSYYAGVLALYSSASRPQNTARTPSRFGLRES